MGTKALSCGAVGAQVAVILAAARGDGGVSGCGLARESGVNETRLCAILGGERLILVDELDAIASALGCSGWEVMRESVETVATREREALVDVGVGTAPPEDVWRLAARTSATGSGEDR